MQMLLKLRSDQTNSVSVDLHQQRLGGDGRVLSYGHICGRLRSRKIKSRRTRILRHRRQSAQLLPFGVAAEISRERPFAPAHRGSGGGGMRGGDTKAARRSISSKGVRNSARTPAGLGLVLW